MVFEGKIKFSCFGPIFEILWSNKFFDGPKYGIFALFSGSTELEAKIAKNAFFVRKICCSTNSPKMMKYM